MNNILNAIIISLNKNISEIKQLAESLNYNVIKIFVQTRDFPDVNSYIGFGKVEEIKEFIVNCNQNITRVIVDGEIKPSQWFNLEKKFDVQVYDRIRLILAIFRNRADRKEARLQVRLAELQYEKPFVKELIHRSRAGEHPGFMAGGEYQVDDYFEMIKKQTKKIKLELFKIQKEREIRRQHRHISGFYLVSLAGYTNAGKSSLFNILSGEQVSVEGRLFSTLSTTTRKINNKNVPVLLTDTVGFIQNLPAWIIDAFHSTLEEISVADIVLLVIDVSEEKEIIEKKIIVSSGELLDIGVNSPIIIVLNKIDLVSDKYLKDIINHLEKLGYKNDKKMIPISVKKIENIDKLLKIIYNELPNISRIKMKLPINEKTQSFISWLYKKSKVDEILYKDNVIISLKCNREIKDRIIYKIKELDGFIIS